MATCARLMLAMMVPLFVACDVPSEPPAPKTSQPYTGVYEGQVNALEKARQVEGQMQQDEAARRQQVEQVSR
jgi:hypothetical protein